MQIHEIFVHNNLKSSFVFPISIGRVSVSSLIGRAKASLILYSDKCYKWWGSVSLYYTDGCKVV